jgi:hypothetical protein
MDCGAQHCMIRMLDCHPGTRRWLSIAAAARMFSMGRVDGRPGSNINSSCLHVSPVGLVSCCTSRAFLFDDYREAKRCANLVRRRTNRRDVIRSAYSNSRTSTSLALTPSRILHAHAVSRRL